MYLIENFLDNPGRVFNTPIFTIANTPETTMTLVVFVAIVLLS